MQERFLMRKRAELLSHIHNTNTQYNLEEIGRKIAYKANRIGVAERFEDPSVRKSIQIDLAMIETLMTNYCRIWNYTFSSMPKPMKPIHFICCKPYQASEKFWRC